MKTLTEMLSRLCWTASGKGFTATCRPRPRRYQTGCKLAARERDVVRVGWRLARRDRRWTAAGRGAVLPWSILSTGIEQPAPFSGFVARKVAYLNDLGLAPAANQDLGLSLVSIAIRFKRWRSDNNGKPAYASTTADNKRGYPSTSHCRCVLATNGNLQTQPLNQTSGPLSPMMWSLISRRMRPIPGRAFFWKAPKCLRQRRDQDRVEQSSRQRWQAIALPYTMEPTTLLNTRGMGGAARNVDVPDGITLAASNYKPTGASAVKAVGQSGNLRYGVLSAFENESRLVGEDIQTGATTTITNDGRDCGVARLLYGSASGDGRHRLSRDVGNV